MTESGLESGISQNPRSVDSLQCSRCGTFNVKKLESEYTKHLMCLNDDCVLIVEPLE